MLGATQGSSELLPISSSGHLILVPWLFDWHYLETHADFNKTFDVALHLGTLVAVVGHFWADVVRYVTAFFVAVKARAFRTDDERLALGIAIATIPAAIAGALGERDRESPRAAVADRRPRGRWRSATAARGDSRSRLSPSAPAMRGRNGGDGDPERQPLVVPSRDARAFTATKKAVT